MQIVLFIFLLQLNIYLAIYYFLQIPPCCLLEN